MYGEVIGIVFTDKHLSKRRGLESPLGGVLADTSHYKHCPHQIQCHANSERRYWQVPLDSEGILGKPLKSKIPT